MVFTGQGNVEALVERIQVDQVRRALRLIVMGKIDVGFYLIKDMKYCDFEAALHVIEDEGTIARKIIEIVERHKGKPLDGSANYSSLP